MIKPKAFVSGISGQDGSYLSEHLLEDGYEVYGIIRRNSVPENQESRIHHLEKELNLDYGDLLDEVSIKRNIRTIKPDLIFNLAAQSHVRISFDIPQFTLKTNSLGCLNMLEAYREYAPNAKFYQASSSEMFGSTVDDDGFQRETTLMTPVSPYGCAKLCSYSLVRNYRKAYGLFAANGILFNHESPRRGSNFVTNKVVQAAAKIKLGMQDNLELGNLDSFRDWGHSKDYTRAMMMILDHDVPDDFVVATGVTHSIRDLCVQAFGRLGLEYQDYVVQNPKYMRPEELKYLKGDASKIKEALGWEPTYSFEELINEMVDHWVEVYSKELNNK